MSAANREIGGERAPGDLSHALHEHAPHVPVFTGARRVDVAALAAGFFAPGCFALVF